MRLRANVTDTQHRVRAQLALDRKKVIFVVGIRVVPGYGVVIPACGRNGEKSMLRIGMA